MKKSFFHRQWDLLLCFSIPIIIMGAYFASRKMAPFGASSILTVDLGQQYVDFFAYLRTSLLHHPSGLLYSFSKGLGGEMWGTNAYYLLSPLNLILLAFPKQWLTSGILLLLLLKYGLAGLSFGWLLKRERIQTGIRLIAFSTSYALMGWMIANQLNLLWLDVLSLLPLVIYGLIKITRQESWLPYLSWLTLLIIDNYYMAWMVCLFTILFFIWQLSRVQLKKSRIGKIIATYLLTSLASVGLSAIILLPTVSALLDSKGTYTETQIKWKFEYQPIKELAKLVPGAFNFNQMPSGQANIYVGMIVLCGAGLYFFVNQDRWPSKVIAGGIIVFLVASFTLQPLDLLWHLGQFPVWYPARFSFLLSFWLVWLAALTLKPGQEIRAWILLSFAVTAIIITIINLHLAKNLNYIKPLTIYLGLGFTIAAIIFLYLEPFRLPFFNLAFVCLTIFDVGYNAVSSLNNISYVSQAQFADYTLLLDQVSEQTKKHDAGFYRVAKDFMRTKDDSFQGDFFTGDNFSSTMEPGVSKFVQAIGQPGGDGFITYSNGTPVTDSLLGFKYFWLARHQGKDNQNNQVLPLTASRPDWRRQKTVFQTKQITVKKNKWALPIAFGASDQAKKLKLLTLDPLAYQSQLYQTLAGKKTDQNLFTVQNFDHVEFVNLSTSEQITGVTVKRQQLLAPAQLILTIKPQTNDPYYLTLGAALKDTANITINGNPLNQYATYQNTIVTTIADHEKGKTVKITISLKKASLWLQNVSLYRLNSKAFEASAKQLQSEPLKITNWYQNQIKGIIHLKRSHQLIMTTIPYAKGWHVKLDGQKITPIKIAGTLMAIPATQGTHQLTMTYWPPLFNLGIMISLLTLVGVILVYLGQRKSDHR
ncbi:YfhO family protein [Lactobacillus sp. 3B(2020)]|uniref:YfhO family protein n=1 Tax=Lactobacillus sp. 3B(2020) TaxID=2695882 RepID=UPI0021037172|nr:YfhO family protein [Lactobacillus sp. 3B(2020)]